MICWFGEVEVCARNASWKQPLDVVEVLVPDQDHRALPQRRHRLVRRAGLVDADADLVGIRQQVRVEQRRVGGFDRADSFVANAAYSRAVGRVAVARGQRRRRAHRRAAAVERVEAREAEPRLVPQEDQVGLDRQALLHDPRRVVHVPVERAVGEVDHPDAVERALRLAVEQRLLDRRAAARRRTSSTASADTPRRSTAAPPTAPGRSGATCGSCDRR